MYNRTKLESVPTHIHLNFMSIQWFHRGSQGGLEPFPDAIGQRWDTPWIEHRQPFTLTFTATSSFLLYIVIESY